MPQPDESLRARLWRDEHVRRIIRFGATGAVTTLAGFVFISLLIEETGMEQNWANIIQAVVLFGVFFPAYRHIVFGREGADIKKAARRWFAVKMTATLLVEPAVFFVSSLKGLPYGVNYAFATAGSGAFSYVFGHWAFGVKWKRVE